MADDAWLEVSVVVDGELAEAVAEVFSRFAPGGGVAIESTAVASAFPEGEGRAVGPLRVAAYLPVDDRLEETRRQLEEALWYLGRIQELPPAQFQVVQETDWAEAWKQHYRPIMIGERLVIVPAWLENPSPERIPIRMDPGMAFGTGTHPTTQLCLELIEDWAAGQAKDLPAPGGEGGWDVIDVGCGSGILSVAALKLGARHALGVDIDAQAARVTRENAQLNGVASRLEAGAGSAGEVRAGRFSLRQAPLVLANILAPILVRLLDEEGLADLVSPGGGLVLSGIIETQVDEVLAAGERAGLRLVERKQIADWVALWMA
jgi:ribosomal protein L11 methyltransferase